MAKRVVDVLVPVALDQTYSYRVPEGLELAPGDLVTVPLGARMATAVTWAENPKPNPRLDNRMKDVEAKLDVPPLKPELRNFIDWVSAYTLSPRGMVLRMALRMGEHLGPARERVGVRIAGPLPQRMTAARERVLALLADGLARGKRDVAEAAGVSPGVIDGLIDEGTLESLVLPPDPVARRPDPDFSPPDFTPAQREAAETLRATVATGGYGVTLLDGVTGAGKTQVYFEAVAEIVRRGKQALVLVPEIALTAQFLDRFAERFGVRPAEWHSQLSQRLRARTWNAVATGELSVIVGARSALFLPYADLGLIVVDEEHDPAYKQEDGARYHARDMAVVRARGADIPIVLVSATPSVETEVNARSGRYARVHLPERFGSSNLPAIEAIDLRAEGPPRGRFFSSIAAATPRSRSAANADFGSPVRIATPGWSIIGSGAAWSATIAASRCRRRRNARNVRRLIRSSRSAPASNGWNRKRRSCFRKAASWCYRAISSNRSSGCARSSTTSPRGASISSSGRSWSPRVTISPGSTWSAWSTPISAWRTGTRARPSARFNCCIRSSAVPGARTVVASDICRPISPSTR